MSEGCGLVVNRDGDSWFLCLEQSMAGEIGGEVVQIWLKVTAESDGGDWIYQRH